MTRLPFYLVSMMTHRSLMRHQKPPGKFYRYYKEHHWHFNFVGIILVIISAAYRELTIAKWLNVVAMTYVLLNMAFAFFSMNFFIVARRQPGHIEQSPLAGKRVRMKLLQLEVTVVDWFDRTREKKSWMDYVFNDMAVTMYAARYGDRMGEHDPTVNEVLLCIIGNEPFLIHVNEIELICDHS